LNIQARQTGVPLPDRRAQATHSQLHLDEAR